MRERNLRTFSFFIKISNGHSRAEAEVFSGDKTVGVFLQVLQAKNKEKISTFDLEWHKDVILAAL